MNKIIPVLGLLLVSFGAGPTHAGESCSKGLAKKFAEAVIEVTVNENSTVYRDGVLSFRRGDSDEYTIDYLNEQISLVGDDYKEKYTALRDELVADPRLHIYNLKFTWKKADNNNLGFYYLVRLKNFDGGCSLVSIANSH